MRISTTTLTSETRIVSIHVYYIPLCPCVPFFTYVFEYIFIFAIFKYVVLTTYYLCGRYRHLFYENSSFIVDNGRFENSSRMSCIQKSKSTEKSVNYRNLYSTDYLRSAGTCYRGQTLNRLYERNFGCMYV